MRLHAEQTLHRTTCRALCELTRSLPPSRSGCSSLHTSTWGERFNSCRCGSKGSFLFLLPSAAVCVLIVQQRYLLSSRPKMQQRSTRPSQQLLPPHHRHRFSKHMSMEAMVVAPQQQLAPRRTATAYDLREFGPECQFQPQRRRRGSASNRSERTAHTIQLESAPWLERQSSAHRSLTTTDPQQSHPTILADPLYTAQHRTSTTTRESRRTATVTPPPSDCAAADGSSGLDAHASHSTACSTDSILSDTTRSVLYGKAVKMSHSMVRKAQIMIKNIERSRALANGSRRKAGTEIEGYRFVQVSKGVAIYEDATTIRLDHKSTRPRLIGVSAVKATLDEFIDTFGRKSEDAFALLNPDMQSCRQMHTISDERERHIGVNWMSMHPTWTGSMARRRDFVVLECEENFSTGTQSNRRGWVQMMHSVQLPWCPQLEEASSIVRGSMYQTGTIALESEASPEWLHVISVVEVDMKGNIADRSQRANAMRRISCLETVAPTIVKQRLQRMSLIRTKQFNAAKPPKENHCSVCTQRIGIPSLRLHHYCRKCSASVCGSCSRNWKLDPATKKKTRVCGLCIMATQKSNKNNIAVDEDDEVVADIRQSMNRIAEQRSCREQTLPEGIADSFLEFRSAADLQAAPQTLNRVNSLPMPDVQSRTTSYFDLPMDPRELMSHDEELVASDSENAIVPFSDAVPPPSSTSLAPSTHHFARKPSELPLRSTNEDLKVRTKAAKPKNKPLGNEKNQSPTKVVVGRRVTLTWQDTDPHSEPEKEDDVAQYKTNHEIHL